MKKLSGNEVRNLFLNYFKKNGHMIEPGASLVPYNDNTLLWINSGVAALKKYFDGTLKPQCNRITNVQKSIRTNDIENVGYTARHHTFFEMLGNFSIGDYFKKEAIQFAWEFLTSKEYIGFDIDKLYISIYEDDIDAYNIWVNDIGVNPNRILKTKHNFWEIGEGPSGPNTEIFYDRGEKYDPENLGEKLFFEELENDRYIEVWNVVFSQYDAKEGVERKNYRELPQKNIDTGMGLERLVCVIQEVETNFDTDLFIPIIRACEKFSDKQYIGEHKLSYRVIGDHIRTLTFALADGAAFSNEGRGYVLRRVLRRAVRFGKKININKPFLYKLVDDVCNVMMDFYPYISEKTEFIKKQVLQEEEKFLLTLNDGEKLLNEMIQGKDVLSGENAFKLYDTYGFPFELTLEIAAEHNVSVNKEEFDIEMQKQKERARSSRNENGSFASQSKDLMDFEEKSEFVGYEKLEIEAKVIGIFKDGISYEKASGKIGLILDKTSFYATSGGQEFDKGVIEFKGKVYPIIEVVKAPHKQHVHIVEIDEIQLGDCVKTQVDEYLRLRVSQNHSATHLLQSALKKFVGSHITQAGAFYNEDYLRFDFTHFEKIDANILQKIENYINDCIKSALPCTIEYMELDKAKASGANALFDEKYGDVVRVVTIGEDSKELCGGTHIKNSAEIQSFKLTSEESVGSGIRRITAITSDAVINDLKINEDIVDELIKVLQAQNRTQLLDKVKSLQEELKNMKSENVALNAKIASFKVDELISSSIIKNDTKYIVNSFENIEVDTLKTMIDTVKVKVNSFFVFFVSKNNDKLLFASGASDDVVKNGIHCGNLVKEVAILTGGNGGGRPNLATAGGKDVSKIDEVIQLIKSKI